jgi:hypothetical protein
MDFHPVEVANKNSPNLKQGTTLFREMYNDIFSDNRNVVIFVLMLLLLMAFSRINFVDSMGVFLYDVLLNLYYFLSDFTYSLIYSIGDILNGTSTTISTVSKTTIDLGNGAIQDIGNLMTDVNCQYKGNPVQPNQCHPPESQYPISNVDSNLPPPPPPLLQESIPPPPQQPEFTQNMPPTKRKIERPTPKTITGKVRPVTTVTPAPQEAALLQVVSNPNSNGLSLDKVLEGMSDRRAAAFVADPVETTTNTNSKIKSSWCLIGEMENKRKCIEIYPSIQSCQSGMLYPSETQCTA